MSEELRHNDLPALVDPTPLTTAQLLRELGSLKEMFIVRLEAMDRAQTLFHENLTRVPTEVDKAIGHLKELHDKEFVNFRVWIVERFESITTQFKERDERIKQTALDTKFAVEAALSSQEKSVTKQNESNAAANSKVEEGFAKQIDQQRVLLDKTTEGINDKIGDLRDRIVLIEGRGSGMDKSWGIVLGAVGMIGMIIGIVFAIMKN
jgi:septation ring formation regulator EzrA